ncbi:hypothetical protein KAU32_04335, partial [bacterium]|nr:hypothetical protein [bacterium]
NFDADKEFLEKEHIKVLKDGTMIDKNGWIVEKADRGKNRITYKAMPDFKMEKVWESAEINGKIEDIKWKETENLEYPERLIVENKVGRDYYMEMYDINEKGAKEKKVQFKKNTAVFWSINMQYFAEVDQFEGTNNIRIYDANYKKVFLKNNVGFQNYISPNGKYFLSINGKDGMIILYDIQGEIIISLGEYEPYGEGNPPLAMGNAYLTEKYAYVMIYDNTHEKDIEKNYVEFYVLNYDGTIKTKIRKGQIARAGNPSFYVFPDEDRFLLSIHKPFIYTGYTNIYTINGEKILDVPSLSSIYYISENSKYLLMKPSSTSSMGYLINMESKTWNNLNKFFGMGDVKVLNDGNIFFVFQDMIPMINKKGDHVRQNFNGKLASYYANKINYPKNLYSEIEKIGENKQKIIIRKSSKSLKERMNKMIERAENEE